MPKSNGRVPSYRLHRPSGQARVIINGKHIYLGSYGSPESRERYARLIAELPAAERAGSQAGSSGETAAALSINELLVAYFRFAQSYYVHNGKPTEELARMVEATWPVRELFGNTPASDFGPKSLKTVRQRMVDAGLSRTVINHRVSRIKRVFKWAVSEELVPRSLYHGLQTVAGLQFGRTEARETEPVGPVADLPVAVILSFLAPPLSAMVKLQRLTGMRPCEVVIMRPCDIDRSDDVWLYKPFTHKGRWRGQVKEVPLGSEAQRILEPFLAREREAYLFSPWEAESWRRENHTSSRNTPVYPSELRARERAKQSRRRKKNKRVIRDHYDSRSYRRAISYAFERAKKAGFAIPHWFPYQLRHTHGTEVRKLYGIEAAQVMLGHARADVTQVYAEKNMEAAKQIAKKIG